LLRLLGGLAGIGALNLASARGSEATDGAAVLAGTTTDAASPTTLATTTDGSGPGLLVTNETDGALYGFGQGFPGAVGISDASIGTIGTAFTSAGYGVAGLSHGSAGVVGFDDEGGFGAIVYPQLYVEGDLIVTGVKNAAVKTPDGGHALVYAVESPENWFEDFGEAKLVRGRAVVELRKDFAGVVERPYHVFLTPHGESNGLYVGSRGRTSFAVHEQGGGRSSIGFSYRIVARRKGFAGRRLERFRPPNVADVRRQAAEAVARFGGR